MVGGELEALAAEILDVRHGQADIFELGRVRGQAYVLAPHVGLELGKRIGGFRPLILKPQVAEHRDKSMEVLFVEDARIMLIDGLKDILEDPAAKRQQLVGGIDGKPPLQLLDDVRNEPLGSAVEFELRLPGLAKARA
jgi:hypothetical protein